MRQEPDRIAERIENRREGAMTQPERVVLTLIPLLAVLGCDASLSRFRDSARAESRSSDDREHESRNGRYQIVSAGLNTFLLDTASGDTWIPCSERAGSEPRWCRVARVPAAEEADALRKKYGIPGATPADPLGIR